MVIRRLIARLKRTRFVQAAIRASIFASQQKSARHNRKNATLNRLHDQAAAEWLVSLHGRRSLREWKRTFSKSIKKAEGAKMREQLRADAKEWLSLNEWDDMGKQPLPSRTLAQL